jgi:hypothetical protein
MCPAPDTGSDTCNSCIQTSCGTQWCKCAEDPNTVDDAGTPGCVAFTQCVIDCSNGNPDAGIDAGNPQACVGQCSAGGTYSGAEVSDGTAFLLCLQGSCATPDDAGMAACGQ